MRSLIQRAALALLPASLLAATALAQAPAIPTAAFESWAPLGAYERTAFAEQGALRIVIPTKQRDVEVAFTPQPLLASGYGAQRIEASGLRSGVDAPGFTAYSGRVEANSGRDFAKLGISKERGRLEGLLRIDGAFYALDADLAAGDFVIGVHEADAAEIAALVKECGVLAEDLGDAVASAANPQTAPQTASAIQLREIELGTEADALFVSQQGSVAAANTRILSIVNMVNGIYETDLGLTNRVVTQRAHTASDPYTTTDARRLLEQFRSEFLASVASGYDDALLFSGRELDGSTVGIAFIRATCGSARFGVLQMARLGDFERSLLAAHELGHNLGARHTSFGIMAPSITGETFFAQASKDEIAQYTSSVSCLALTGQSGTNSAPTLDPVGPQIAIEGQPLTFQLVATDPEGDRISYGATPLPVGASLSASGLFSWTPARSAAGCNASAQTTVQFTASDGVLTASETVPIWVDDANTNASPQMTDPADRDVYVGRLVQFQLQASDADGDSLTFAASGLPTGATLSPTGGFSWTPGAAESANATFTATDCTGLAVSQSVLLSATVQPPPHLAALSQTTGWVGDVLTLSGTALSGNNVSARFAGKSAPILALSDTSISLRVPKIKKKLRKAGAQPVTLVRDGVSADNVLSFDYVKP
jgi:Metallo-peptidase family M12/Putative Ig domain